MMFGIWSRLIAAALVVALLGGIYWRGHTQGYKARETIALADDAARVAEALQASETARLRERELTRQVETQRGKYAEQIKNTRAVAAAAGVGFRDLQQAVAAPAAAASASATARTDDAARARIVVGQCAQVVQSMAAVLDEREQQLIGLQEYVKAISK